MTYLEKYSVEHILQRHLIKDFPKIITNENICSFFNSNEIETNYVNNFIKKNDKSF